MSLFRIPLICLFSISFAHAEQSDQTLPSETQLLNLAATSWCPYVCDDSKNPGFIVTYMRTLLAQQNIELSVTVLPWSRAIKESRAGKYDGLLTAVRSEAEEFKFPNAPTGYYQDCLFGRSDSPIRFEGRDTFKGIRVGGVKDYGYGSPIGDLFSDPQEEESIYLVSSNRPLDQLTGMLEKQRIDLVAGDKHVMEHYQNNKEDEPILSVAGCLEEVPFYTAISPATKSADAWIDSLEHAFKAKNAQALYLRAQETLVTTTSGD